ncbi:MAG TPA: hypothetical protein VEC35_16945 [Noviherbaspirillum sp.]|nr:hypothetical protein [Noviherbaspirillum sp.]
MNSRILICAGALALLSSCGGSGDGGASAVLNATLPSGANSVLLTGEPAGSFGEAFLDAEGNGVLLASGGDERPVAAYYDIKRNTLRRVPALDASLQLGVEAGATRPVSTTAITLSGLAGSYSAIDQDNKVSGFTVAGDGAITPAGTGCKVSGTIESKSGITGVLPLFITLSGCGSKDGSYQGYVISAAEYAPATFRIVAENQQSFIDMLAFK